MLFANMLVIGICLHIGNVAVMNTCVNAQGGYLGHLNISLSDGVLIANEKERGNVHFTIDLEERTDVNVADLVLNLEPDGTIRNILSHQVKLEELRSLMVTLAKAKKRVHIYPTSERITLSAIKQTIARIRELDLMSWDVEIIIHVECH